MSTAVATGVVALVLDAHNTSPFRRYAALTPNLVKGILQDRRHHDRRRGLSDAGGRPDQCRRARSLWAPASIRVEADRILGLALKRRGAALGDWRGPNYFWSAAHPLRQPRALRGDLLSGEQHRLEQQHRVDRVLQGRD